LYLNSLVVLAMQEKLVGVSNQEVEIDLGVQKKIDSKINKIKAKFVQIPDKLFINNIFPFIKDSKDFIHLVGTCKMLRRLGESCTVSFNVSELKNKRSVFDRVVNWFLSKEEARAKFEEFFDEFASELRDDIFKVLGKYGFCAFLFIDKNKKRDLILINKYFLEDNALFIKGKIGISFEDLDVKLKNAFNSLGDYKEFNSTRMCCSSICRSKDCCLDSLKASIDCLCEGCVSCYFSCCEDFYLFYTIPYLLIVFGPTCCCVKTRNNNIWNKLFKSFKDNFEDSCKKDEDYRFV
jgi:hypothetical protein